MQPKYLKDALAVLELYRTSGPELYWKEAKAAMLTRRDKAAFGTAHAQMSAPLDGLEGGGRRSARARGIFFASGPEFSCSFPRPAQP